ncbi:uncharacterized protein CLUP02_00622 [Colletotrichum lupini]|uniref:Uncharacterized protein n=1 Tax=Colletotrichum lupini TaxID=145971 RepID=A0A9Q8SBF9_9PEZI|nr:uncharacterized protein CLUP02_00622 [Colletotrichum lupini]UQC73975.1 hypothetical protein CLUP02_00622 [Colletotrichum lupini]
MQNSPGIADWPVIGSAPREGQLKLNSFVPRLANSYAVRLNNVGDNKLGAGARGVSKSSKIADSRRESQAKQGAVRLCLQWTG